jgi:hypothetical protein
MSSRTRINNSSERDHSFASLLTLHLRGYLRGVLGSGCLPRQTIATGIYMPEQTAAPGNAPGYIMMFVAVGSM